MEGIDKIKEPGDPGVGQILPQYFTSDTGKVLASSWFILL